MMLSDLERWDARGQLFPADPPNYARTVWPGTTTIGKVADVGEGFFLPFDAMRKCGIRFAKLYLLCTASAYASMSSAILIDTKFLSVCLSVWILSKRTHISSIFLPLAPSLLQKFQGSTPGRGYSKKILRFSTEIAVYLVFTHRHEIGRPTVNMNH